MSYEKQTWNKYDELKTEEENIKNGAVVTDNRMNHIEEGIYSHTIDISNPHKVTAAQVGLGNIQNFGLATEDEAKQGDSNAKYMTPSLTQAVLSANINSIAYANSADGTDGFTTVYPNLNLLKNTRTLTATSTSSVWNTLFSSSQIYDSAIKSKTGVSAMNFSFDVFVPLNAAVGSGIPIQLKGQSYQAWGNVGTDEWNTIIAWRIDYVIKQSDLGKTIRVSSTVELGAKYQSFDSALADTDSITIRQSSNISGFVCSAIKLEIGSTATPHMPSSSEVTTNDWPKYVGFSNTVKTNKSASDYTWFPVKDSELTNKVESHINNKANPHAVTASQVGAYTKTESDSKLTDLSNKVIANKGNLASGTDLDNVIDIGTYRIGGLTGGTDIINVPSERSGTTIYAYLTVSGTTTSVVQELIVYDSKTVSQIYSRSRSGSTPTFSPWSKTVMADDSGKVKLTDFEVTTISETVNIGNGLSLNFQRKGEFVLVRFSGSLTAINSGTYFSTAVPEQWRPDGIKELIGHFASGALAFHVDLETDGRVKWWGASGATGAPRGTAMYFLK
ncbi:DUF7013 family protein [Lactococcus cremoris]|uniref:DUF7013 family protein n=2 Tax=Lactococcus TaxID=1357 RepID=UPI0021D11B78|nr:hypothetical protein [Lactococcus cremoris]UXV65616.1 hypothetical protein LLNCDO700_11810 [Lactococcus cremoris]